jgi:hypothetical protein
VGGGEKVACRGVDVDPHVLAELRGLPKSFVGVSEEAEPVEQFFEALSNLQSMCFRRGEQ